MSILDTSMNKNFVLVSSLFNINREEMSGNDGRTWDDYLMWFEKTLQLKSPMIIFCEDNLVEFVKNRREYPTKIITHTVSEIPYYFLKDKIQMIISSEKYQKKIDVPQRIECKHPMYTVVQYSKFKWLDEAIRLNPFDSKYFFWIDAGASRHFEDFDINNQFPSQESLDAFEQMGEKFLLQLNMEFYKELAHSESLTDDYLWDARSITCGSFFGGEIEAVKKVNQEIDNVLITKMIDNEFVNNEQIALAYLLKTKPEYFVEYRRYNGKHMDIFRELS
jgi:Bacterial protein of unknown function (HtrL_YibB)